MSEIITLAAEPRDRAGKGVARATRREGRVPGVIYGGAEPPVLISLDRATLGRRVHTVTFFTHLFDLEIGGKKHRVLPRDVQLHPLTDLPIHVDFLRIGENTVIDVKVPVLFINQEVSPGLKRGGVLNVVRHDIDMRCPANNIPEHITVDLTGFEVGDSIHISHVHLPEGVQTSLHRDFTIATVAAPSAMRGAEKADEAADAASAAAASAASAAAATPAA